VPQLTQDQFEKKYPEVANLYSLESSHFLGWDNKILNDLEKINVSVIQHNATSVVKGKDNFQIVRHDPMGLAKTLKTLM
jgi:hypothetical protein